MSSFNKKTQNPGYKPGNHWTVCDRTGKVIRVGDARKEWTGLTVAKEEWEPRHPQDFLRSRTDDMSVAGAQKDDSMPVVGSSYYDSSYATHTDPFVNSANSDGFTFSFWFNSTGPITSSRYLFYIDFDDDDPAVYVSWITGGGVSRLLLRAFNDAGTSLVSSVAFPSNRMADNQWHHVLYTLDISTSTRAVWVDDAEISYSAIGTDSQIEWEDVGLMVFGATSDSTLPLVGAHLTEFWFDPSPLDISSEAVRRKFINEDGSPATLGINGEDPTGTAPVLYFPNGDSTNNKGSGGNFTAATAVTSSSPTAITINAHKNLKVTF